MIFLFFSFGLIIPLNYYPEYVKQRALFFRLTGFLAYGVCHWLHIGSLQKKTWRNRRQQLPFPTVGRQFIRAQDFQEA